MKSKSRYNWLYPIIFLTACGLFGRGVAMEKLELQPCPNKSNCVSSLAQTKLHAVEAFRYQGDAGDAMRVLLEIIQQQPRTSVLKSDEVYIHSTFTSLVFRFVDDVEFLLDKHAGLIHVRSASRVGESDFGVNRKRVEKLRALFLENMKEVSK